MDATWPRRLPVAARGDASSAGGRGGLGGGLARRAARPGRRGAGSLRTPTLLLVGGADSHVLELNREARRRIGANVMLEVIPRATHLFEEPGALGQVADHAADWFERHLGREHGRVQQAG
ncbi:S9 family peptidase [Lysobacter sp. N42]|uniref:alpha/beta hydrolase family protein n=1 Tax=Lysobacter sp. N42 TaxID=2545719 RepID=UPI001044E5D2|nr:hypothetical protein [Lysobacter sp. N42]TCZ88137.1 hypothetical protein EYQ95_14935 [Lysobacter sp. N42]